MDQQKEDMLKDISKELRIGALETIKSAGHGHVGSSMSSADLMTALYFNQLNYDIEDPNHKERDRVLVRGHVGPLRYKLFSLLNWIDKEELSTYRHYPTKLKGHESMHHVDGVDITPSGSLGMLLSYGVGSQIAAANRDQEFNTYVFLGDGEEQEGNVSEAARHAASMEDMDNLIAIMDQNQKQLSRPTEEVDGGAPEEIWEGYGWKVYQMEDGHDMEEISETLEEARESEGPSIVIAPTVKGLGVPGSTENPTGYHTSSTCEWEDIDKAIEELKSDIYRSAVKEEALELASENRLEEAKVSQEDLSKEIEIEVDSDTEMNMDYAQADYFNKLDQLIEGEDPDFYFLNADWVRKSLADMAGLGNNIEYHDVGIREQHLTAAAHGLSVTDPDSRVIVNIGDFLTYRAADQIFTAGLGKSNLTIISDTGGLTQNQNGKTHQSAGQPGMIDSMTGVNFYEPADVEDMFNVLNEALTENEGVDFIRTYSYEEDLVPKEYTSSDFTDHYVAFESGEGPDIHLVGSGLVTPELYETAEMINDAYDKDCRLINIGNHDLDEERFAEYFDSGKPVFVAYNGSSDFVTGNVSKALIRGGVDVPDIYSHGFSRGDTGTTEELLKEYKLDSEGLFEVISQKAGLNE
ncbi:MAG: hypothetical protein SVV03_02910 [Candidatus Nanohaloarchaea archaeon]|nr:hypothetical protein [Candidatus Nanohaloarchaea archaeon]